MAAPSGTPLPPNVPAERPPSVVEKAWNPALTFLYVPERKIWADKKDAATIYALLPPDELAPCEMFVYIISSEGFLAPEALVIPKGQNSGKTRLTSDRPGTAQGASANPDLTCPPAPFTDVPCTTPFYPWVKQLVGLGVTAGCGGGNYCPGNTVTRAQMSVFLSVMFGMMPSPP